ncbi:uncharacterized protein EV422DRAFT_221555 [Fimicolochytrium jonesii]|uniref:uncharacterized protein n=1 Tax=Fimicolochytrium jonesii TaxID=1396493 RepID=UPI0022FE3680|nr:uncharacterized protein EV422DRAFT_221555 [Fimicolochytrium jonesii]KAI8817353.1 hypothetical protein EV422DRAFT_221555 [Fimicolochytrium jonesii]
MRSDSMTRTYMDCVFLRIVRHIASDESKVPLRFLGAFSATYTSPETGITLSGANDYFLGYGNQSSESLANVSLVSQAKTRGTKIGDKVISHTLAHMLMVHMARKRTKKEDPRVYRFATIGWEREFLVFEDDGRVGRSHTSKMRWQEQDLWRILSSFSKLHGTPTRKPRFTKRRKPD